MVEDNPIEGLQLYVVAPPAVIVVLLPEQIVTGPETVKFGNALTVAVTGILDAEVHPVDVFLASA